MKTTIAVAMALAVGTGLLSGCAAPPRTVDYAAFRQASPRSLLVLPPLNESPDIKATPALWAHATRPLSEAGYYVLPVTLVDQTLRSNGVDSAADAQSIGVAKLREQFGADAAVYLKVTQYGTRYVLLGSETLVKAEAKIVDLRTGTVLWQGSASASSGESQPAQGSLAAAMVTAIVRQIIETTTDASFTYAGIASDRLLGVHPNGVLPGPRYPKDR